MNKTKHSKNKIKKLQSYEVKTKLYSYSYNNINIILPNMELIRKLMIRKWIGNDFNYI